MPLNSQERLQSTAASVAALLSEKDMTSKSFPREACSSRSSISSKSRPGSPSGQSAVLVPSQKVIRQDEFASPSGTPRCRAMNSTMILSDCTSGASSAERSVVSRPSPQRHSRDTKSLAWKSEKSNGVKEAEQTIANKLLEAMELVGQSTAKSRRGSTARISEDEFALTTSGSGGPQSALGGVAQSVRSGCKSLLRRNTNGTTSYSSKESSSLACDVACNLSSIHPGESTMRGRLSRTSGDGGPRTESAASGASEVPTVISIPYSVNLLNTPFDKDGISTHSKDSEFTNPAPAVNAAQSTNECRRSIGNMSQARQQRTNEIVLGMRTSAVSDEPDLDNRDCVSPWESERLHQGVSLINHINCFRLCGIIGWRSLDIDEHRWWSFASFYQWFVFLLTLAGLGIGIVQVLNSHGNDSLCYSDACLRLGLLTDIPLFVGTVFGLLSLGTYSGSRNLSECIELLLNYSTREGWVHIWKSLLWRDMIIVILIWLLAVLERIRGNGTLRAAVAGNLDVWAVLHMMSFTISTGLLMGLTFCILFFCRAFMTMVDTFCANLVEKDNLEGAVRSWNILQAILRKASSVIERCFFVLQTTAFSTILVGVADIVHSLASDDDHLLALIPCALVCVGVATIFFSAANVTEKCARVPSLVNSMSFGVEIDTERQYVVDYINNSTAGFYVFEVRLTSAMSWKFTYFCIVAAFTLTTWLATQIT